MYHEICISGVLSGSVMRWMSAIAFVLALGVFEVLGGRRRQMERQNRHRSGVSLPQQPELIVPSSLVNFWVTLRRQLRQVLTLLSDCIAIDPVKMVKTTKVHACTFNCGTRSGRTAFRIAGPGSVVVYNKFYGIAMEHPCITALTYL